MNLKITLASKRKFNFIRTYADFGNGDVQETAVAYDALGNIISKTGVGVYQYGSQCSGNTAGPHAVCAISAQDQSSNTIGTKNAVYSYDPNGNMLSGDGRSITWSLFDKPTQIQQNGNTTLMGYGPERQLLTRQDSTTAGTTSTVFVGGLYEKVTDQNGNIKERHYVGSHTIVTYRNRTASSAGTIETRYLHKDHIGSVVLITDENGNEVESFSFDPWGKRRAPSLADLEAALGNWNSLDAFQKGNLTLSALSLGSDITNKGFTGHEQMDGVNLIHMGGRVYDAEIGRFLSADPFVQDSTNIQALNRYSYVQNNPLSYTDPSGYFLSGLKSFVKKLGNGIKNAVSGLVAFERNLRRKILRKIGESQILSVAVSIGLNFVPGCQGWCTMAFNAAMADANGGTIAQILTGAAIGAVTSGVPGGGGFWQGGLTGRLAGALGGKALANAGATLFMGGALAKAQGGKFIDGVKGAAAGLAAGALINAGVEAYRSYQMRRSVVFGGRVGIEFESPAMDNTLGAVPEPTAAADAVNTALPAGTAEIGNVPESAFSGPIRDRVPLSLEASSPVNGVDSMGLVASSRDLIASWNNILNSNLEQINRNIGDIAGHVSLSCLACRPASFPIEVLSAGVSAMGGNIKPAIATFAGYGVSKGLQSRGVHEYLAEKAGTTTSVTLGHAL